jgi:hypothetical protein
MMKRQGYDVQFFEYGYDIEVVEPIGEDIKTDYSGFLTVLILTALQNIKEECFVIRGGSQYSINYKNRDFDYWFKYASANNDYIFNLYCDYKQLTKILHDKKQCFEVLFETDLRTDKGKRVTNEKRLRLDSKKIVKRYAFAAAYYKNDSLKFKEIVEKLKNQKLSLDEIIKIFEDLNNKYETKIYENTSPEKRKGLTASMGVVQDLKKHFVKDLASVVRKILLTENAAGKKQVGKTLIRVLSNHFKTSILNEKRQYYYLFEIVGKKDDFATT